MKSVLLTGFDPFAGEELNPAGELIRELAGTEIKGFKVEVLEVPTERYRSLKLIEEKITELNPRIVISIGQAGGRTAISIERVAINVDDYRIEDNKGNQPVDEKINQAGPAAYFSTLPVKAMLRELHRNDIPAELSNSAGTFVCNHLMYGVLDYLEQNSLDISAGFIHLPYLPAQVVDKSGKASMSMATIKKGITVAIESAIESRDEDIKYQAGKTH